MAPNEYDIPRGTEQCSVPDALRDRLMQLEESRVVRIESVSRQIAELEEERNRLIDIGNSPVNLFSSPKRNSTCEPSALVGGVRRSY